MIIHPVILAGGSGTRLWPMSRAMYPKQFLPLLAERTLLQETIERLDGIDMVARPIIVCNEENRFLVAEQVRQLGDRPCTILLEPVGRNTAPALTLAALAFAELYHDSQSDTLMLVLPADHIIRDVAAFHNVVEQAVALAEVGHVVTFGVAPTSPNTGYGYIKMGIPLDSVGNNGAGGNVSATLQQEEDGAKLPCQSPVPHRVDAFTEKPDPVTARAFLESKDCLWNSGIFMMRASVWLEQLALHRPDIAEACKTAYAQGQKDGDFYRPDSEMFAACPSDSIDHAVIEKVVRAPIQKARISPRDGHPLSVSESTGCVMLLLDAEWSDIDSWSTLWDEGAQDGQGNVINGDVYARSTRNSLLMSQHRLVAAVGLDDLVVIETADAVLVAHKDRVQEVRDIAERLKAERRPEYENHRKVHRPWGSYEAVDCGPRFQVKRLVVNPGAALSLQMHHHRAEHWVVVRGTAKVTRGEEEFLLTEDQSTYVPVGVKHRLENPGTIPLEIIEVQSGAYLGEDDIVRFEDRYNRHVAIDQSPRISVGVGG